MRSDPSGTRPFTRGEGRVTIEEVLRLALGVFFAFCTAACAGGSRPPAPTTPPSGQLAMDPLIRTSGPFARTLPIPTRREDVVEDHFGHSIADPYRWLEDEQSDEVRRWTDEQNALTRRVLDRVPGRDQLHNRLHELLSIGSIGTPASRKLSTGKLRYFYTRRDGHQNQPVLYVREGLYGKDEALVDPNGLSSDGTTALDWWYPSEDGRLLAYGLSENGDEQSTLYVRDVDKKSDLPDRIDRTRYASVAWLPDNKSFYYTRFPAKGTVPAGEENYHRTVFLHRLGDDPAKDTYVFGKGRAMTDSPAVELSADGRWLLVTVYQGWAKSELLLRDLKGKKGADFVLLTGGTEAVFDAAVRNDAVYVRTNDGASRYRVYAFDPAHPARASWKEILPEHPTDVLDGVAIVGGDLLATYLADASSRLRRFSRTGEAKGEIPMPTIGSTGGAAGRWDGEEAFYDFSSFAVAPTIYRLDLHSGQPEKWEAVDAPIDPAAFEVERITAPSKDGTPIPAFLVHKKGLQKTGKTPTLLTGYGGFNINIVPSFSRSSYLLLERGGILAVANLRGGGEFGEAWHRAGMLEHKQNVFDDAIAMATQLISAGYTDSAHLGVMGGSNGGLLVGALVTQRPDLFRAAVCSVPLLDMLRYDRFRIAKLWVAEYGSPEDPAQFEWLYAYSPYHRVRAGTAYPAVLFTAAESDSRVDPMHARKMTAAMQAATTSEHPILLRLETRAGHGAGKPLTKTVEELTDVYSFLFAELEVK